MGGPSDDAPTNQMHSDSHGMLAFTIYWSQALELHPPSCLQPIIIRIYTTVYQSQNDFTKCSVLITNLGAECYRPSFSGWRSWIPEKSSHLPKITQLAKAGIWYKVFLSLKFVHFTQWLRSFRGKKKGCKYSGDVREISSITSSSCFTQMWWKIFFSYLYDSCKH